MRRLVYLPAARRNLEDIFDYIVSQSQSSTVAETFTDGIRRQCLRLASLPGQLGRARPELRPDIRSFASKGYVIFFRYADDRLEVVNILEGHRDFDAFFGDRFD